MSEQTATILVVDDNEAERYYVARVLRKAGFAIREGMTGGDALRLAQEQPDLITLDVRLPDFSGLEVCRRLKADVATRDIPVLHISASFTTPEAKVEGLQGGADGYLTHPVDPAELVATVQALLRAQRAETRVRAAAREWVATFDLIEDPLCVTGRDTVIARCNQAFARYLDRPFTAIVGRRLEDLIPELAPLVATGTSGVSEVRVGERHFRLSSSAAATDRDGNATRVWLLGDITERRRAEESLRQSEERAQARLQEIEAIYDAAPIGLCVLDQDLRFVRINEQLAAANGLSVAGHLGRTVREVLPALADAMEPKLRSVLETGRPVLGLEIHGETPAEPGAQRVWIEHLYPLHTADGRVIGINIAAEEVTQQRRAQEQLEQAQRLESVGRLAGGVAHETNNQMTVVLGCANFALRHPAMPRELQGDLEQIRHAAERTASITAQLLAFGRRQYSRPEVMDLHAAIRRLQPILERAVGPLSVLRLELDPAPALVKMDAGQLDQVMLNLAINSRDAMPTGGTLTLRSARMRVESPGEEHFVGGVPTPGDYVRLAFTDTGHGMSSTTLERAFEPFFTTKDVGQGTGLGLSMVYGIVRQSGGFISVASEPAKGATFVLYLPEVQDATPPAGRAPSAPAPARRRTILIVEDDPRVRSVLAREMQSRDYRVLEASHGRAALELVETFDDTLDVVVTDIQMPVLDGRALARELARRRPGLPVVFMSGHPEDAAVGDLLTSGNALLQKPFTGQDLASLVEALLPAD